MSGIAPKCLQSEAQAFSEEGGVVKATIVVGYSTMTFPQMARGGRGAGGYVIAGCWGGGDGVMDFGFVVDTRCTGSSFHCRRYMGASSTIPTPYLSQIPPAPRAVLMGQDTPLPPPLQVPTLMEHPLVGQPPLVGDLLSSALPTFEVPFLSQLGNFRGCFVPYKIVCPDPLRECRACGARVARTEIPCVFR